MNARDYYSQLVDKVIEKNKELIKKSYEQCCDAYKECNVIETDNLKITFEGKTVQITRKANNNPVFKRDDKGNVYRIHGEAIHLKKELLELAEGTE